MAEQVEEQRKINIVNKINKRYQNLIHDVNKAEEMGIRVNIEINTSERMDQTQIHYMNIDYLDRHLMEKAKRLNNQ